MIAIVGFIIVLVGVLGGFVWEGGQLMVLFQPAEFLIIGGCALGSLIVASPIKIIKLMMSDIIGVLKPPPSKEYYVNLLVMLYEVFQGARKDGLVAMETHIENPQESKILTNYPDFLANHHLLNFFVDTMRLILSGGVPAHDLEALIDNDLDKMHEDEGKSPASINKMGDALPGFGIVAAVMGIVLTMGAIGGPPEVIGHKVGAALVGTFLGILLSYGFVAPLASNIEILNSEKSQSFTLVKQALLGFHKGMAPSIAVEFARRSIGADIRPGFIELEEACKATRDKG
ncbi:MAG: flagellar motor stator protein MotA [candidate division Zixibacteria bacterium]|nr:flagellar motor stator protein MotA [candidate division Zixibacteria bacterium]